MGGIVLTAAVHPTRRWRLTGEKEMWAKKSNEEPRLACCQNQAESISFNVGSICIDGLATTSLESD
jgi:hypothetical protein